MKKILLVLLLLLLSPIQSFSANEVYLDDNDLIGAWHFEETSGNISDESTNGNNLTVYCNNGCNSTKITYQVTGHTDYGVQTNSYYLDVFYLNGLNIDADEFTLGYWIKTSDTGEWQDSSYIKLSSSNGIAFESNTTPNLNIYNVSTVTGFTSLASGTNIYDGSWHFVVLACSESGNICEIDIDNDTKDSDTYSSTYSIYEIAFCARSTSERHTSMVIDDAFLLSRYLSTAERTSVYTYGIQESSGRTRRMF